MDILFFKVWRNKLILNNIFSFLKLFIKYYGKIKTFENINKLFQYKRIEYIRNIKILNNDNDYHIGKSIPWGIESVEFGEGYSDIIERSFFPSSLLKLKLGRSYNHRIEDYTLPESLTSLQFGDEYNHPVDKNITFKKCFKSIQKIKFGNQFNQKLNSDDLSNLISLKELVFGHYYSKSFEIASLPSSIEILEFGYQWNHSLSVNGGIIGNTSIIPINCKSLIIMGLFNQPLNQGDLPNGLLKLHIGINFNQTLNPGILPNTIENLSFGFNFNNGNKTLDKNVLPLNLKSLTFGSSFNSIIRIDILPNGLQELIFGRSFNQQIIKNSLPESLTNLQFGECFSNNNKSLKSAIPTNNLKRLLFKNQKFKINQLDLNLNQDCEVNTYYYEIPKRSVSDLLFCCCYSSTQLFALLLLFIQESITGLFK